MTVTILLSATPELLDGINSLVSALTGITGVQNVRSVKVRPEAEQQEDAPTPPKKKPTTPAKMENEEGPISGQVGNKTYSLEEVRAAATKVSQSGKRDDVKALIKEFGVNALPDIAAEDYTEFMTKLNEL